MPSCWSSLLKEQRNHRLRAPLAQSLNALVLAASAASLHAAELRGIIRFHGVGVPGVSVVANKQGDHREVTTDASGTYSFVDLPQGRWHIAIHMLGFAPSEIDVDIPGASALQSTELSMLPAAQVLTLATPERLIRSPEPASTSAPSTVAKTGEAKTAAPESPRAGEDTQAAEGLLVNGSTNNAATSQYSLDRAFGNQRSGSKALYTGGLAAIAGSSLFDARPYSLTGVPQPQANYERFTTVLTFGGPLNIPRIQNGRTWHGPNFFVVYQRTRNSEQSSQSGLVPTLAQRATITQPIPRALLALYPLPNLSSNSNYNYQTQVLNHSHIDALQLRLDRNIGQRDELRGTVALQSARSDNTNLFGFKDATATLGLNATSSWQHRLRSGLYLDLDYRFSRFRTTVTPFFADRINISGNAGLTGTLQDPRDWGPPTLIFSSGIASLSDVQSAYNRNRSDALAGTLRWYRGHHNVSVGGEFRREEFNYLQQQDPRGTFTFTGAAFGSDVADFAESVPDVASTNFGNADKYLRHSVLNAFVADDWRLRPELTLNLGVRWEYDAPITELKDRLANLDVAGDFSAAAVVTALHPTGPLTGQHYPTSLLRPDRKKVEPRVGLAWRPLAGSSLVVRAGYGVYADSSVYESTALQLAEQSPFANSLSVNNSTCPQSLRTAPTPCSSTTVNTFAVDPNFRVGYAQTWSLSAQRDLPGALVATVSYLGVKGTRGVQDFLPNTNPLGAVNPCPACPVGFLYRSTYGNSERNAGTVQLRRRLRSGLTASLDYTYSRSVDDDSILGGQGLVTNASQSSSTTSSSASATIAQNWRDLRAERGLSTFDQRNLLSLTTQYTTGMGVRGGTLLSGWRGRAYKEWTVAAQASFGTGLPETPIYLTAVNDTGFTGSIRPNRLTGDAYRGDAAHFFNASVFTAPTPGQWGNAGRDSLRGPGTYSFNASLSRTFRIEKRYNLDVRADTTNLLNHVVFTSYNNVINPSLVSPLFGVPLAAGPMRTVQLTGRFRF